MGYGSTEDYKYIFQRLLKKKVIKNFRDDEKYLKNLATNSENYIFFPALIIEKNYKPFSTNLE